MTSIEPIEPAEYEERVRKAQALMEKEGLDALLVTWEQNFRYFTGDICHSPYDTTRPRFLVIPSKGDPIAVLARGVAEAVQDTTWVKNVRSWPGPNPADEGVSALVEVLKGLTSERARIGTEMGPESRLGVPYGDFQRISAELMPRQFVDAVTPVFHRLRVVKSPAEVRRIRKVCELVSNAYAALPMLLQQGDSEVDACRKMEAVCFALGVDKPGSTVISGHGGHIMTFAGPTRRVLGDGDVMFIDTGCMLDYYYCDFNRHFAFGSVDPATAKAYDLIWDATEAGINSVKPGVTASDVWNAMHDVISAKDKTASSDSFGRMGHSMGLSVLELPSIAPQDHTVLQPGMILNIEPSTLYTGHFDNAPKLMVHEENVVVTHDGCELMTRRTPRSMPVVTRPFSQYA